LSLAFREAAADRRRERAQAERSALSSSLRNPRA
jgi:hypothetical protein